LGRVLQGAVQGVLVGVGFLGGGILLRDTDTHKVFNLTSAAEVWAVAAMGLATRLCAMGDRRARHRDLCGADGGAPRAGNAVPPQRSSGQLNQERVRGLSV